MIDSCALFVLDGRTQAIDYIAISFVTQSEVFNVKFRDVYAITVNGTSDEQNVFVLSLYLLLEIASIPKEMLTFLKHQKLTLNLHCFLKEPD